MSRQAEAHLVVAPMPRNVRVARQFLCAALHEWGSTHLEDVAALLVSELLTNVILHSGTPGELSVVRCEGRVRVEVRDGGAPLPPPRHYALEGTTGRGLKLVSALSTDWGVEPTGSGKVVWFELDDAQPGGDDAARNEAAAAPHGADGGADPHRRGKRWRGMRPTRYGRRQRPWRSSSVATMARWDGRGMAPHPCELSAGSARPPPRCGRADPAFAVRMPTGQS